MQFKQGSWVQGVQVRRADAFRLVEAATEVVRAEVDIDTIFVGEKGWVGQEVSPSRWTLVDVIRHNCHFHPSP